MLPVQIDFFYRTGAFAIAVSIARPSRSPPRAIAGDGALADRIARPARSSRAALFALNPNVLYLQSTPMTEPLLFALTSLVVVLLTRLGDRAPASRCRPLGWIDRARRA